MTFEERNEAWTGKKREFRQTQTRSSIHRVWKVSVTGDLVSYEWGQLNGAMQHSSERGYVVNQGKKNEISADDYALYIARERARKKHWEGYREIDPKTEEPLDHLATEVDFENPPLNLSFWKPLNNIDESASLLKKAEAKQLWYARKMNGLMYQAWSNGEGKVKLLSRKMLAQHDDEKESSITWNDRFPHLIKALEETMAPRSCMLGELVAFDEDNKDSLRLIESYTKSLTIRAIEDQTRTGWAYFYIWDIAFWDEQDLAREAPIGERYNLIGSVLESKPYLIPVQVVKPGEVAGYETVDQFRELAKHWGWEGFVAIDPTGVMGDRAYNFKGKPDRPGKVAAKVKPVYEDDFVMLWNPERGYGEYSNKNRYGSAGMKSATLWQFNKNSELIYIANVASGLTEEMKTKATPSDEPQVWHVEYTDRRYMSDGDDTNALDFPRFVAVRTDKSPSECMNPKL